MKALKEEIKEQQRRIDVSANTIQSLNEELENQTFDQMNLKQPGSTMLPVFYVIPSNRVSLIA